jgi:hypothetical protein
MITMRNYIQYPLFISLNKVLLLSLISFSFFNACHSFSNIQIRNKGYVGAAQRRVAACQVKHIPSLDSFRLFNHSNTLPDKKNAQKIAPGSSLSKVSRLRNPMKNRLKKNKKEFKISNILQLKQAVLWIQQDFTQHLFTLTEPPKPYPLVQSLPKWNTLLDLQVTDRIPQQRSPPSFLTCQNSIELTAHQRISTPIPNTKSLLRIQKNLWSWGAEKRRKAIQIHDVALDLKQKRMYLVGNTGLWSWSLGKKNLIPLSLPPSITPPLSRIYQDGKAWWIRTGLPQDVMQEAYLIALDRHPTTYLNYVQKIPARISRIQVPLANGLLTLNRSSLTFTWQSSLVDPDAIRQRGSTDVSSDAKHTYHTAPIRDVAVLDAYHVVIAHDLGIDLWQKFPHQDEVKRVAYLRLNQTTVRLIFHQNILYMFGESYGILWAHVSGLNSLSTP